MFFCCCRRCRRRCCRRHLLFFFVLQIGVPQNAAHLLFLRIRLRFHEHIREKIFNYLSLVVADFEEEQVIHALETNRTDGWQAKQQLSKSAGVVRPGHTSVFLQSSVNFFAQQSNLCDGLKTSNIGIEENNGSAIITYVILL